MVKSQIFYLRLFILSACLLSGCAEVTIYKKEFTAEEKHKLAEQIGRGAGRFYYQGDVGNQLLLQEALALDSTLPEIWRELATPYLKRGLPVQAFKYYAKEVQLAPELWQGWRGYLYLYFYRDYERALADFNATDTLTVITDYPQGQSVDYMRGLCYYGMNDYQKAMAFFSRYISEVSKDKGEEWVDVFAFIYRGLVYEKLGQPELALKDFETGQKYDQRLADFHFHKARLLLQTRGTNQTEIRRTLELALQSFRQGFFHQRDYVEVHDQLYEEDILALMEKVKR